MNAHQKFAKIPTEDDVIDIAELLTTLWRGKYKIAFLSLVALIMGAYYAFEVAPPKYRATTTILLDTKEPSLMELGVQIPTLNTESEAINTEVEILKSRSLLARVADASDLISDPEFNLTLAPPSRLAELEAEFLGPPTRMTDAQIRTSVIDRLLQVVSVRNVSNTYTLQITATTSSPEKSAALADEVAAQYIRFKKDVKREVTEDTSEWLSSRVLDLKAELEVAEARLSDFSTNAKVVGIEEISLLNRLLKEQRERLAVANLTEAATLQKAEDLAALRDAAPEAKLDATDDRRLREIFDRQGASASFDREYTAILRATRATAAREGMQVRALEASVAELETQIATQNAEMIDLQQLTREAEASRLLYEYFLSRLKENSAQEGIHQGQARVLSHAVPPNAPSEPHKPMIMAAAMLLGFMVAVGYILLREYQSDTYRQSAELQSDTGLSVLGQIPMIPMRRRKKVIEYLKEKPISAAMEAIRNLRTSIVMSDISTPPQVVMLTSSLPGEGKTTLSLALAQNYVGLGKKVLLIEGDIRRLVFSQYFDLKNVQGMASVLEGKTLLAEAVLHEDMIGCDVLVGERVPDNAADLFSSPAFTDLLEQARADYDYIIIDTPPVLVVPDARVISQFVDAVILTVKWDATSRAQVRQALEMFYSVGIKVNGAVLNQINPVGMKRYGYGDAYGAYGSYGAHYYAN